MAEAKTGTIIKVAGPVVSAEGMLGSRMYDVVRVSKHNLIGEIVELKGDTANIQVYEDTTSIGPGEPVVDSKAPLSVELGPGLIESIYDGIQRPLDELYKVQGNHILRGSQLPGLNREKKWHFKPVIENGTEVAGGDIIGDVQETPILLHKIMIPPTISGKIAGLSEGDFTVEHKIATVTSPDGKKHEVKMMQKWPVRTGRTVKQRLAPDKILLTGQRIIDTFFPIAIGGTACVPGPFGSGKTVVQHQLAKWVDADVVVYVGCGERGNEMTDVLTEFPKLKDPRSGQPLMKRSVLIANTSDMPVAAREASVYTGITIAEYFRDMGYTVALMADSTSRWAEAMREISTRLEEMPAEEGYPAYLASRIASFYERAGRVECLGKPDRQAGLSIIGAVSPPGGDLSDSVVQATLHVVKVFWSLMGKLAYQRHFPAIDWLTSYSFYKQYLPACFEDKEKGSQMLELAQQAMSLLEQESGLAEIVRLVGSESISPADRMVLQTTKSIREDYLHQNAFHEIDTYTSMDKQFEMLKTILHFHVKGLEAIENGVETDEIFKLDAWEDISRSSFIPEDAIEKITKIRDKIDGQIKALQG
jgi:V/A-type H+-transporting ATPase subunit A